ncbi:MAG: DNA internalization-related competence protein ComEC/Rec2 [Coriobacteriia bacterium]|nr:DNA internalization-related competence protein ComEC/Rec2 [Coriobacteriia bacterium]
MEELKATLLALGFGYRPGFSDTQIYSEFRVVGLAHLVAVSGAHLALVSTFLLSLVGRTHLGFRGQSGVLAAFLGLYVLMVGIPVSCLRAALMALLGLASRMGGRRSHSLSALGLVIILFIGFDPACACSLSFQLSVLATLGICLFAPWVSWWLSKLRCLPRSIVDAVSLTCAATIPTLPVTTVLFSQLPLVAPLSNLVAAPFLTLVMGICLLLVPASVCSLVFDLLVASGSVVLAAFVSVVHCLSALPASCIPVSSEPLLAYALGVILCVGWWVAWPSPCFRSFRQMASGALLLVLLLGLWSYVPALRSGDRLVMLDVGQGDSFLFESQGKTFLVDTGRYDSRLLAGLASEGVNHLDGVLITHCDDDHYGSLEALLGVVDVDRVFVAKGSGELDNGKALEIRTMAWRLSGELPEELAVGSHFGLGSFSFWVVSPKQVDDGGNQDSLVVMAQVQKGGKEWLILLTGDAESETLESVAREGLLCDIDILKVPHHGSRVAVSEELLDVIRPEVSLVSVGEGNRYGHPTQEALEMLEGAGSKVYRSDKDGKVVCNFNDAGLKVACLG